MNSIAIRAEGHTVRIPSRRRRGTAWVHAATDMTFSAHRGRVHAIVGESGCGKTTFASAILGMLPAGTVAGGRLDYVDASGARTPLTAGLDGAARAAALRGRVIGYVPQSPATYLTAVRTVGSQLQETVRELGGAASPQELLAQVSLEPGALDAFPHELSGGMLQRAAIAFALAGGPDVLLADEPVSGLDPDLARLTLGMLRSVADSGAAVILITHDLQRLMDSGTADEVSVMYAGRIVEAGPAAEVLGLPAHPYTRDLLAALPANGLQAMPGTSPELTDLSEEYSYADRLMAAEQPEGNYAC
ncbi:ATP-binding cassette domain-containing protein [Arthrobacter caoxuetaonis]|uniref:ATP-binding cassette domain-containing protein n=1 Tax=Arthrobacter caoxuetaonis TaxID=2886935 RepID=UPI001D13BA5F|nr:ATP-binding cassette domain-containing protein [Arthrobacter caoxuetaonis]MCC3283849.1 ATP-binding cassette domain-containing protein [Arthrobacter caoxuetaonis]